MLIKPKDYRNMTANDRSGLARTNNLLKEKLQRWMPESGRYPTAIEGFTISRRDEANQPETCFYKPLVGVIVQGFKRSIIGSEEYRYGESHCLVAGVDMPSVNYVTVASPEQPFLAMSLILDTYLITQLAAEIAPSSRPGNGSYKGMAVAAVDPDVLDAFLRLVELLEKPEQIPVLAPMIIREIHYRLLIGAQGERLRVVNTLGTQSNQIAKTITWLRDNYKEPLQVDELARKVNMATSTFHRHFREVTTLSPLQFQKRMRLYEAQRLMLAENEDAAIAALAVGYESPTQFNREYKRLFGEPPHRHVSLLK
jgi:AraC-like DNA-binding protein